MKDLVGAICSTLCIAHCVALPAAVATGLPLAGMAVLSEEESHCALSLVIVLLALWAFPSGWRRHQQLIPSVMALVGIGLLVIAILTTETLEAYLVILASISLIAAHLTNRHLLLKR